MQPWKVNLSCRLTYLRGMAVWLVEQMTLRTIPGSKELTGSKWPIERRHPQSGELIYVNSGVLHTSPHFVYARLCEGLS